MNSVDVHSPPGQGFKWGLGFYLCGWGQGLGSRKTGEDLGAGKGRSRMVTYITSTLRLHAAPRAVGLTSSL